MREGTSEAALVAGGLVGLAAVACCTLTGHEYRLHVPAVVCRLVADEHEVTTAFYANHTEVAVAA